MNFPILQMGNLCIDADGIQSYIAYNFEVYIWIPADLYKDYTHNNYMVFFI